jgi:hypothetical protein
MNVQPGPVMCRVVVAAPNGNQQVILHFEHATGSTILPMDGPTAEALGGELVAKGRLAQGKPVGQLQVATLDDIPKGL